MVLIPGHSIFCFFVLIKAYFIDVLGEIPEYKKYNKRQQYGSL